MEEQPVKKQRRAAKACRPEQQAGGSAPAVYSEDAHRYDAQQSSSGIQGDMAALAVALLGQVRAAAVGRRRRHSTDLFMRIRSPTRAIIRRRPTARAASWRTSAAARG